MRNDGPQFPRISWSTIIEKFGIKQFWVGFLRDLYLPGILENYCFTERLAETGSWIQEQASMRPSISKVKSGMTLAHRWTFISIEGIFGFNGVQSGPSSVSNGASSISFNLVCKERVRHVTIT